MFSHSSTETRHILNDEMQIFGKVLCGKRKKASPTEAKYIVVTAVTSKLAGSVSFCLSMWAEERQTSWGIIPEKQAGQNLRSHSARQRAFPLGRTLGPGSPASAVKKYAIKFTKM